MKKEEIHRIIKQQKADIICVELCQTRFNLMVQQQAQEDNKDDPSLIGKISNAIKKKAEKENLQYGSDMINASKFALENNIPLAFIDLDIYRIKELMDRIPKNEQQGFMKELAVFENESLKKEVDEEKTLMELKTKYPVAFEFLITIRELVMLNRLLTIDKKNPNQRILAFVGKGHLKSLNGALDKEIKLIKGGEQ